MFYGVILESARDGVIIFYGDTVWKRIVNELKLPSETFELFVRYDHKILLDICECMAFILQEGTAETYLEFFGKDFVRYFINFGFEKILRVAGRTLRDFLFAIDQLHDSKRFTFPDMYQPLFHVTEENGTGAALVYKSIRHGFTRYAVGGLVSSAKTLFQEDIKMNVIEDLSTKEYAHIVFWVHFDNKTYQPKQLNHFPILPDINGTTFFRVFPFSILMDSRLRIHGMGTNIKKLFPPDTALIGRSLDEVFRLIRPDIYVEWDKILSYGRHIVFLIENRLPLRSGPSGRIRLKGQMKYIENKNMLWFLCHPVLGSADDVVSAGLHLTDLNLFDNTSDLLITGMQQERAIEDAFAKQNVWLKKSQESKIKLIQWRQKSQRLLNSVLPRHIVLLLQSGVPPNCIYESHPLVTILFAYMMDFKSLSVHPDPTLIVQCLNEMIDTFDKIGDNYDVFKVETKADASYMVVAGLSDRLNVASFGSITLSPPSMYDHDDEEDEEMKETIDKNPSRLHQTEIIASLALDLLNASQNIINPVTNEPFKVKIGFHTGSVVGGIVGMKNVQYCLYGDTVNMASRITTSTEIGRIHLSHSSYVYLVQENRFTIEYRGETEMKGKGTQPTYWLMGKATKIAFNGVNKSPTQWRCPFTGKLNGN